MYHKIIEKLQVSWENFTEREKRILAVAGAALFFFVIALPFMLMTTANGDIEQEIDDMKVLLDDIESQRDRLQSRVAEKRAADKLYRQKAPQLGGFLESLAREQGLTIQEANDEPEKTVGKFLRRGVQVSIPKVPLTPIVKLMAAVDGSHYPVAIERLQIEHFQEGDTYNFRLGVVAYDKESAGPKETPGQDDEGDEEDGEEEE
jgi:general secretion pathway protein M